MTDFINLALPGVQALQPYQPGKAVEELERELGLVDAVKLASNENPLGASEAVSDALLATFPQLARYPDGSAYILKNRLSEFLGVSTEMITVGNGSNDVLELLGRVFLNPHNEAVVSQHSFVVYPLVTKAVGARLKVIPAKNYKQDLKATLESIQNETRMVFIANPNNPTGTWVTECELIEFLENIPKTLLVVLDEAYFEYVDKPDYPDGISLVKKFPNLIVTRTFSKAYGLAALRIGYAVSHPDIADLLNRIRQPFNVNSMSLVAALAALDDQKHVEKSVSLNQLGLDYFMKGCDEMELSYIPSVANFLTIDLERKAMPIYEGLLRLGIIVRPVGVYELPNHLRVTTGLPGENELFLSALKRLVR